jgi:hypothetical protein
MRGACICHGSSNWQSCSAESSGSSCRLHPSSSNGGGSRRRRAEGSDGDCAAHDDDDDNDDDGAWSPLVA